MMQILLAMALLLFVAAPCFGGEEELDDLDLEEELQITQLEIREQTKHVMGLGLGESIPWQMIAGRYGYFHNPQLLSFLSLGGSVLEQNLDIDQRKYKLSLRSQGLAGGVSVWPSSTLPVAISSGMQIKRFTGNFKPTFSDTSSDFKGHALSLFVGVNLNYYSERPWFIEWLILGAGKNLWLSSSGGNDEHQGDIRRAVATPRLYGMTNLTFGTRF
jgi:hypothetical protein